MSACIAPSNSRPRSRPPPTPWSSRGASTRSVATITRSVRTRRSASGRRPISTRPRRGPCRSGSKTRGTTPTMRRAGCARAAKSNGRASTPSSARLWSANSSASLSSTTATMSCAFAATTSGSSIAAARSAVSLRPVRGCANRRNAPQTQTCRPSAGPKCRGSARLNTSRGNWRRSRGLRRSSGASSNWVRRDPHPCPPCIDRGHHGDLFGDIVDTFPITNWEGSGCHFAGCRRWGGSESSWCLRRLKGRTFASFAGGSGSVRRPATIGFSAAGRRARRD